MLYPNDYLTTSTPYPARLTEENGELVLTDVTEMIVKCMPAEDTLKGV